jgi:lactate dehydrogenase-like 2-hydroxyacid dehydrogenase
MWLPEEAKAAPNLKFIQFFSAGTNHVAQHPIYTDSKIPLCSANGVHGPQIAEWVIMMDLVHSHRFPKLYDLQKEKTWNQQAGSNVSDRVGKRVGILGYGSIGRQGKLLYLFISGVYVVYLVESLVQTPLHTASFGVWVSAFWIYASNIPRIMLLAPSNAVSEHAAI